MASICKEGGEQSGLVFPATTAEQTWPTAVRIILYGIALVYFFVGVAIVADIFMGAIETVTSRRVQRRNKDGQKRTKKFWNDTVATLTLMALGSSAPEIFLSVIDIVKKKFHFGALGPSTIVGSAAFNLLVIIAVCVFIIPSNEIRLIDNRPAFYITAVFSLGAYLWMAFILTYSSPNIVTVWEAVVTAGLLPVLVYVSYKVDRGDADFIIDRVFREKPKEEEEEQRSEEEVAAANAKERAGHNYVKFSCEQLLLRGTDQAKTVEVSVSRTGPLEEASTVNYHTESMTAVAGFDYEEAEGSLEFAPGEQKQTISLEILPRTLWRAECQFLVVLEEPEGGDLEIDPQDDGGDDISILTIVLDPMASKRDAWTAWKKFVDQRIVCFHMISKGFKDWWEQICCVLYCNGSAEEQAEASKADWACHLMALPWKILFSVLPPTTFFGGWVAFYCSLGGIAIITACVSDLAELFGCVLGVPDIVTAVTFVALGTSMPDLFASLSAAKEDPSADASIVNVTGSNSVNVFLGLGVPWTIAAIYWMMTGRTADWEAMYPEIASQVEGAAFVVESKNLGFSVLTFCVVCCVALMLLHLRRKWLGGELGGPVPPKINTFLSFLGLWGGWVALVSWRVMRWTEDLGAEVMMVQGSAAMALFICTCFSVGQMKLFHVREMRRLKLEAEENAGQQPADRA
mmetsp:Transcript_56068/g.142732  ORF Transcript_56068/g.142732 Transcript_56068/m.142732 type:complete len:686 (-) Transcript_56068:316-2373(-)